MCLLQAYRTQPVSRTTSKQATFNELRIQPVILKVIAKVRVRATPLEEKTPATEQESRKRWGRQRENAPSNSQPQREITRKKENTSFRRREVKDQEYRGRVITHAQSFAQSITSKYMRSAKTGALRMKRLALSILNSFLFLTINSLHCPFDLRHLLCLLVTASSQNDLQKKRIQTYIEWPNQNQTQNNCSTSTVRRVLYSCHNLGLRFAHCNDHSYA